MTHFDLPIVGMRDAEGRTSSESQGRALRLMTTGRLLLVPILMATFMVHPGGTTIVLLVFMFADLGDGVVARRLNVDDRFRRATDSIVDRIAIDACLLAACAKGVLPWPILAGVLARDLWCGLVCSYLLKERQVVIKGDLTYRALAGSFAIWALAAPFVDQGVRNLLAGGILVVSILVAVDFTRAARMVLRGPADIRDTAIPVTAVRRGLDHTAPAAGDGGQPAAAQTRRFSRG